MMSRPLSLLCAVATALPLAAQSFDPPVALDVNPDPSIVEVQLSAVVTTWQFTPGVDTTVWAYSDDAPGGAGASIPGPTIKANMGDTLIVNFTNNLPDPTTIHWHGIENLATMDGSHISQLWVQPGESFRYEFPLLKDGLYWFHPHVNTYDQVEKGLHACLLVKDPVKEAAVFATLGGRTVEEHIVVFDDILLDETTNQVVPAFPYTNDPLKNAEYHLNGRVGNVLLVNGRAAPITLPATNGAVQSWYCVNMANTSICRLKVTESPYVPQPQKSVLGGLYEVGSDGGKVEFPYRRIKIAPLCVQTEHPGQVLLSHMFAGTLLFPGERMQVVFTPIGLDGEVFEIEQWDWFRGDHVAKWDPTQTSIILEDDPDDGCLPPEPFINLVLTGNDPGTGEWIPTFSIPFAEPPRPVQGKLPVTFGHGLPDPTTGAVTLFAQARTEGGNIVPLPAAKVGSLEAHDVSVGDVMMWEITNLTHGDHPFHMHGFFFELMEYEWIDTVAAIDFKWTARLLPPLRTGQWVPPRKLKDTIRVPARIGAKGTSKTIARLRVYFDDTGREGQVVAEGEKPTFDRDGNFTSGGWLFHCHVLEHSGKGMLSFFELRDRNSPFELLGHFFPGTTGNASLTARGSRSTGLSFDVVNARPNNPTALVGSWILQPTPLRGGTFLPLMGSPEVTFMQVKTSDAQGAVTWSYSPSRYTPTYWQILYPDPGAAENWAFSNALKVR